MLKPLGFFVLFCFAQDGIVLEINSETQTRPTKSKYDQAYFSSFGPEHSVTLQHVVRESVVCLAPSTWLSLLL